MKISGEIKVKAGRAAVFDALCDARFFASCIDGVGELTQIDEKRYAAILETRVAYLQFKFKITVQLVRVEPPSRIEAKIEGTPLGIVGHLTATTVTTLTEAGDETLISYTMDMALMGKLGSVGQPVLKSKAREMEKQFTKNLAAAFESATPKDLP
jgi:carbon monoxide dehydrogenase subunit G